MRPKGLLFFLVLVVVLLLMAFAVSGCSRCSTTAKHIQSNVTGLQRTVILFDANGRELRRYQGRFTIEDRGGSASFVHNGKTIIIAGTYVIEED